MKNNLSLAYCLNRIGKVMNSSKSTDSLDIAVKYCQLLVFRNYGILDIDNDLSEEIRRLYRIKLKEELTIHAKHQREAV